MWLVVLVAALVAGSLIRGLVGVLNSLETNDYEFEEAPQRAWQEPIPPAKKRKLRRIGKRSPLRTVFDPQASDLDVVRAMSRYHRDWPLASYRHNILDNLAFDELPEQRRALIEHFFELIRNPYVKGKLLETLVARFDAGIRLWMDPRMQYVSGSRNSGSQVGDQVGFLFSAYSWVTVWDLATDEPITTLLFNNLRLKRGPRRPEEASFTLDGVDSDGRRTTLELRVTNPWYFDRSTRRKVYTTDYAVAGINDFYTYFESWVDFSVENCSPDDLSLQPGASAPEPT